MNRLLTSLGGGSTLPQRVWWAFAFLTPLVWMQTFADLQSGRHRWVAIGLAGYSCVLLVCLCVSYRSAFRNSRGASENGAEALSLGGWTLIFIAVAGGAWSLHLLASA